jgi:hypothetical protein
MLKSPGIFRWKARREAIWKEWRAQCKSHFPWTRYHPIMVTHLNKCDHHHHNETRKTNALFFFEGEKVFFFEGEKEYFAICIDCLVSNYHIAALDMVSYEEYLTANIIFE